jgi:hypothetical protein
MNHNLPRGLAVVATAAALAFSAIRLAGAGAASPPARPTTTPPPAGPIRIHATPLSATGLGSVEAPFSMKIATQTLTAEGLGTAEPPFRTLHIKTDALTAQGQGAAPGGPK